MVWNDLCECVSNAQVGRQILDMLRRMTRSYCNDVECPEDGTVGNNSSSNAQVMMMTFILGMLILGITMQVMGRRRRQQLDNQPQKPSNQDNNNNDRSGPRDPPPTAT